jgi:hypothetical protein
MSHPISTILLAEVDQMLRGGSISTYGGQGRALDLLVVLHKPSLQFDDRDGSIRKQGGGRCGQLRIHLCGNDRGLPLGFGGVATNSLVVIVAV